ncbi:MAG: hypothetical protein U5L08_03060 [Xanthomonadales bacterium]|nr:hypothetical protein [Xanthomonadales bacterium]
MLPISKHRTLVIPHRLALVAAAVCLALSFTADRGELPQQLQAEHDTPTEQLEATNGGSASISGHDKAGKTRDTRGNPTLLPWFSGLFH